MEPPPAPTSAKSITGTLIGNPPLVPVCIVYVTCTAPPTSYSVLTRGSPRSIRLALAVVPPMSKEIIFLYPASLPKCAAAITPAAGPDSTTCIGFAITVSEEIMPPLDCMR